jgi:single-stranded DNA-binding protein
MVGVEGRLALRGWREAAGRRRQDYSIIGRVQFLDRPPEREVETFGGRDPESDEARRPGPALAAA